MIKSRWITLGESRNTFKLKGKERSLRILFKAEAVTNRKKT